MGFTDLVTELTVVTVALGALLTVPRRSQITRLKEACDNLKTEADAERIRRTNAETKLSDLSVQLGELNGKYDILKEFSAPAAIKLLEKDIKTFQDETVRTHEEILQTLHNINKETKL